MQAPTEGLARSGPSARVARNQALRRAVQIGFLFLSLAPLAPVLYERLSHRAAPILSSWLLPWDPLLLAGHIARRDWNAIVIGAPLLLIALTLVLGRFFCSWVCPLGATLDLVRPLAFWRRRPTRGARTAATPDAQQGRPRRGFLGKIFPANANSHLRYYLLIGVLAAGVLSLQALGLLDPLVIFHRATTALATSIYALQLSTLRTFLALISLIFLAILALELWQPRFWCRNLCPLGALLSIFSRWSLLNRHVGEACSSCAECRRACPMNAIPRREPHDTDYSDCTFCLECQTPCPKDGITFGFGALAGRVWQRGGGAEGRRGVGAEGLSPLLLRSSAPLRGQYVPKQTPSGLQLSRRQLISGAAAGAAGLALAPVIGLERRGKVIRPPGALPEDEFVRTCILCQECVRVCTTSGLRPTTWEAGWSAIGTPQLIPRAGACTLNPSCPQRCAQVCPVGAIQPLKPEQMRLGLAVVERPLCLAWDQGVKCLVCVEACLVEAAQMYNGRIVVDPARCTGCGRCENACPVAGGAIRVRPLGA